MKFKTRITKILKKAFRCSAFIALSIVMLFLLLAIVVYLPPVQQIIKNKTTEVLSRETGLDIKISKIRLSFPLDLLIDNMSATDHGDTIVAAQQLLLDVKLLPLIEKKIELNGFELHKTRLNTKDLVSDINIDGHFNLLAIDKPAICDLDKNHIDINKVRFQKADINITLSDTAQQDTTTSKPSPWLIKLNNIDISDTQFCLHTPGDTINVGGNVARLTANNTILDLKKSIYRIENISLGARKINYDISHIPFDTTNTPRPFDTNHILLTSLSLDVSDFCFDNKGINADINRLALAEQCGLTIKRLSTKLHYDSTRINLNDTHIETPHSKLDATVLLPFSALSNNPHDNLEIKLNGEIGKQDISLATSNTLNDIFDHFPSKNIEVKLRAQGSADNLELDYCNITMTENLDLRLHGIVNKILDSRQRNGQLHYSSSLKNTTFINGLIPRDLRQTISIPAGLQLGGDININGNTYSLSKNTIYCGKGKLSINGKYNTDNNTYSATLIADRFPLQAFLRGMNLSPLTSSIKIKGHGTDFTSRTTSLDAAININNFAYNDIPLNNINLSTKIKGGNTQADITADNSWLKATLNLDVQQAKDIIDLSLVGNIDQLSLNFGAENNEPQTDDLSLIMGIDIKASIDNKNNAISLNGTIDPLNAMTSTKGYPGGNLHLDLTTNNNETRFSLNSGDMNASLYSPQHIESILSDLQNYTTQLATQFADKKLNPDTLKNLLPQTHLAIKATHNNPLQQILSLKDCSFDSLSTDITTDKTHGINAELSIVNLQKGNVLLEHSKINITQNKEALNLHADIKNSKRKNPNRFSASLDGALLHNGFSILARFVDATGREGLNIGTRATFDHSGGISLCLIPEVSTIAYRKFKVNSDNFIAIDSNKVITANVNLLADDNTALRLFSMPTDTTANQDVTLSINHLNLRDVSSVVPYMPKMAGFVSGDIHVLKENNTFTAVGAIETTKLQYEGTPLGSLGLELFYMPEDNGHYVMAQILNAGREIAVLDGHYNDMPDATDSLGIVAADVLNATLTLDKLPCNLLNPIMGEDGTIGLKGNLNGEISLAGPLNNLKLNGELQPDSIHAYSELYGYDLAMENKTISIKNGKIIFDKTAFKSTGENPLIVDGSIDLGNFSGMDIDLNINANDFEIINARKTKKSMVYGKVFVDFNATMKNRGELIVLRGELNVLDKTNVTYVMIDTPLQVEDQFNGLVEFTNFTDSQHEEEEQQMPLSGTFVILKIGVSEQARLHCELSADGKSYVNCTGGGDLTMQIFPSGEIALNGRFNINSGEMKYTLPFIPLKTFTFTEGNHILFNGDPTNPTLNITALETTKAAVTDDNDHSRMVTFKVGVSITRQLSDMGIEFLIEAPEDLEVQNELATLSKEAKNKLAITMLATGMYASTANKAGFKATNALNAFLENEIQNIAGSALKTIDISVGVEGNTTSTGETQTDYTFQFSKKLWNDRITFVLGGKVTTGATNNTSSQSFIDNISFEYRLDDNSSRYIRVFYDNNTYDPLEGNYSSAGAGYIMRRKTNHFGDLLIFKKKKK